MSEADAYDFMLTQNEIQSCVDSVNGQVKEEARQAKCEFASLFFPLYFPLPLSLPTPFSPLLCLPLLFSVLFHSRDPILIISFSFLITIVSECVSLINSAVTKGSMTALLNSLQQERAELKDVIPQNLRWYNDILSRTRAGNGEVHFIVM